MYIWFCWTRKLHIAIFILSVGLNFDLPEAISTICPWEKKSIYIADSIRDLDTVGIASENTDNCWKVQENSENDARKWLSCKMCLAIDALASHFKKISDHVISWLNNDSYYSCMELWSQFNMPILVCEFYGQRGITLIRL